MFAILPMFDKYYVNNKTQWFKLTSRFKRGEIVKSYKTDEEPMKQVWSCGRVLEKFAAEEASRVTSTTLTKLNQDTNKINLSQNTVLY